MVQSSYNDRRASALSQWQVKPNGQTMKNIITYGGAGALLTYGLLRRDKTGIALAVLGGGLVFRRLRMSTVNEPTGRAIEIEKSVFVNCPVADVYRFWRDFENFPMFMDHIESVRYKSGQRSHWEARIPGTSATINWDAELIDDRTNQCIAWRSVEGSDIYNEGVVIFQPTQNGHGTQVNVRITYKSPVGRRLIGGLIGQFLNAIPTQFIKHDLQRFKRIMEAEHRLGLNSGASPTGA